MQIFNHNSPNFNANIKFVDTKNFAKHYFDKYFYCAHPSQPLANSLIVNDKFWTSEVRTCTAGGVVGKNVTAGYHFYDCIPNVEKTISSFVNLIKTTVKEPLSALIIGSKEIESASSSVPLFEAVVKETKKLLTPSEFKTYAKRFSEADIAYERATDTWFVNAFSLENPLVTDCRTEIKSVADLKSMFKSIKIAPQDKLFIGEKEVLRTEHPELFV